MFNEVELDSLMLLSFTLIAQHGLDVVRGLIKLLPALFFSKLL